MEEQQRKKQKSMNREFEDQYTLVEIMIIWVLAAGPMALLGWIGGPLIEPLLTVDGQIVVAVARMIALTIGLIWLFVLSMIIVYREEGNLRWTTIKNRLWLEAPLDPNTGDTGGKVWLWFIPFFVGLGLLQIAMLYIDPIFHDIPGFGVVEKYDPGHLLEDPEIQKLLEGAWWFLFLFLILAVFNTVLGEEFLFRGILLPKMKGVFGKYDWVANGVLMGAYHLHQPWTILGAILSSVLIFSLASRRYKSTWMGIALHSIQSVIFLVLILGIVLGLV